MPPALAKKQFGLPRYVWLIALAGGVVVGLYLRSRRAEAEEGMEDEEYAPLGEDAAITDAEAMEYNGLNGIPVGYYDAVSGSGDYLPDPVGPDAEQPIVTVNLPDGTTAQKRVKRGPRGPRGKPGAPGKRGKRGPGGPKGVGSGGPPKRPKPKGKKPTGDKIKDAMKQPHKPTPLPAKPKPKKKAGKR